MERAGKHDDEDEYFGPVYSAQPASCPHCHSREGWDVEGFTRDRHLLLICLACHVSIVMRGYKVDE